MKATLWLWSLVIMTTMLCVSQVSPLSDYQYTDSRGLQENYYKRTKPSLSIVNPLDVLRQRLLLEIARRQMKENTKQVEINRAILKNVGKRDNELDYFDYDQNYNSINKNLNNINHKNNIISSSSTNNNNIKKRINSNNNNNYNKKETNINNNNNNNNNNNDDDDYQIKYVYSLHKNSFSPI